MRILFLTFYFPPDLSAGSFRATALVDALAACGPAELEIDVATTLPNRYQSFNRDAAESELRGRLEIHRVALPRHRSDMFGQARAFIRFAREVSRRTASQEYDMVFATSSRLMTAVLGARIAKKRRIPLYLDIRDIFADTIADVLPPIVGWPLALFFSRLESSAVAIAERVNLVSPGFESYFRSRYGDRKFSWFTNGIDDEFASEAKCEATQSTRNDRGKVRIVYAGNLGAGQALHTLIPELARRLADEADFVLIGDGGRKELLAEATAGMPNVELRKPVGRAELLVAYRSADILLLHLGQQPAFEKVLPSKIFEYAAMGKPILAGVSGFAAKFLASEVTNCSVFPPGNVDSAIQAYRSLELLDSPRSEFVARYSRSAICRQMAQEILSLLPGGSDVTD